MKTQNSSLFQMPADQDLILFLIKKELEGTKFVSDLQRVGFSGEVFSMDLGVAILTLMGFHDRSDEVWAWYYETLNGFVERVGLSEGAELDRLAVEFYAEVRGVDLS